MVVKEEDHPELKDRGGVAGMAVAVVVQSLSRVTRCREVESDFDRMGCISPIALRLSKAVQFVPCGKCNFCLASKRADWTFRLAQELKVCQSAHFLTLTYDDVHLPWTDEGPSLCKRDMQLFMHSLRKANRKVSPVGLRYYTVGEYGTNTLRPHYHSIMFNLSGCICQRLDSIWKRGFVSVGNVTEASIHYVTKYVINRVGEFEGRQKPFALISNRSGGLGMNYVESNRKWHKGDVLKNYAMYNGFKVPLPRVFRDKIFSVREKERLAKESISQLTVEMQEEIVRLTKFHPDPWGYYLDRIDAAYKAVNVEKFKKLDAL